MKSSRFLVRRATLGGVFALVFSIGYLLGTLDGRPAEAQVGDLGKDLLDKASASGGMLGSAAQLGTTITEMQTNVNELQENIDALNKIKEALGG
jgi:hypothetical protein